VRVDGDLACNDGELLFDWVKQGLGIGWRSTWEIQAELKRGELVTVLDEYAVGNYPIQAVFPQQRYLPAKIRHFIDHLKAVYNTPGYWERQLGTD
jgi:DNA-binding transcriptional LysR family regulator